MNTNTISTTTLTDNTILNWTAEEVQAIKGLWEKYSLKESWNNSERTMTAFLEREDSFMLVPKVEANYNEKGFCTFSSQDMKEVHLNSLFYDYWDDEEVTPSISIVLLTPWGNPLQTCVVYEPSKGWGLLSPDSIVTLIDEAQMTWEVNGVYNLIDLFGVWYKTPDEIMEALLDIIFQ